MLQQFDDQSRRQRTRQDKIRLIVQAIIGVWLVTALALHLAEVGLIGLSVIILATSLTGVTDEHAIGKAFTGISPFTALLTVFFSVVAVIIDQQLFHQSFILSYRHRNTPSCRSSVFLTACCHPFRIMSSWGRFISTKRKRQWKVALSR